jgi:hypothetical protein
MWMFTLYVEAESMVFTEKLKWIILPALLVIGVGVLEIHFPHAMDGFDDNYTGRGAAGLIVLLFELFIWLTWGKIGGVIAILLGTMAIVICLLPKSEQVKAKPIKSSVTDNDKNLTNNALASFALRVGKNYF